MRITEIKKLKRLYKVTLDQAVSLDKGEAPSDKIYVTEDTIVKFRLSKEPDYDEKQLQEIAAYANYSRGKNTAVYFLSFRSRTAHEVEDYLIKHEVPQNDIPKILSELTDLKLIDDAAYAERAIENALILQQKGPYAIKHKLMQHGILPDLAESKLEELYPEEEQLKIASKIAQKKSEAIAKRTPSKILKQKLQQMLVTRGFSYSISENAIDSLSLAKDLSVEHDLLVREAEQQYKRLAKRYESYDLKQRLTQSLIRKGFDWPDVSDILDDYDFDKQ